MFDRVVIAVRDEEGGRDAIDLVKMLIPKVAELTLLHVQVLAGRAPGDTRTETNAVVRRYALKRLTELQTQSGVTGQVAVVQSDSVRRGVGEFATDHDAQLLVIGASQTDDTMRDLVGDDTRALLEKPPCPVAVAPIGYAAGAHALDRIGVAYDGSPASEQALALARGLASEHGAALSAFEAVGASIRRSPGDFVAEFTEPVTQARRRISALGGLQARAGFGDAATELVRYGSSVDLLVIGGHSLRPIDHLLRTTAQQLADAPPCPLLILTAA